MRLGLERGSSQFLAEGARPGRSNPPRVQTLEGLYIVYNRRLLRPGRAPSAKN
jgi:hypothetical protein